MALPDELRLRADPTQQHVPVLMLPARADDAYRLAALAVGVDDYLTKPFATAELLAGVRAAGPPAGAAPLRNATARGRAITPTCLGAAVPTRSGCHRGRATRQPPQNGARLGRRFDGRKIRALTIVDNFSRQCLAIHVGQSLKGEDVVAVMTRLHQQLGVVPERIQVDNGSEFISKALDRWAYDQHVTLDFSRPGKPTNNPYIESFNGSFRDECLNVHWFLSLIGAQEKIEH